MKDAYQNGRTYEIAQIGVFVALISVCSWISVPAPVPFTLQTFGVFAAMAALGGRKGTLAVASYLLLGAFGAPVFSQFRGGPGMLLGNTGGYLVGFLFLALLVWAMERAFGRSQPVLIFSMILGLFVCYAFGTVWFMAVYSEGAGVLTVLSWCVFPFVIPDLIKMALALAVSRRLRRVLA